MLDNLTQRMARVVKTLRGEARLTEANTQEMLREVRLALSRRTWRCPSCASSSPR
jgi:Signal recognition particle GTPase